MFLTNLWHFSPLSGSNRRQTYTNYYVYSTPASGRTHSQLVGGVRCTEQTKESIIWGLNHINLSILTLGSCFFLFWETITLRHLIFSANHILLIQPNFLDLAPRTWEAQGLDLENIRKLNLSPICRSKRTKESQNHSCLIFPKSWDLRTWDIFSFWESPIFDHWAHHATALLWGEDPSYKPICSLKHKGKSLDSAIGFLASWCDNEQAMYGPASLHVWSEQGLQGDDAWRHCAQEEMTHQGRRHFGENNRLNNGPQRYPVPIPGTCEHYHVWKRGLCRCD